jgi:hypothetical protein
MRVQRMSLVQTLRQYVFVHRAIISYYLSMLDQEARSGSPAPRSSIGSMSTFSSGALTSGQRSSIGTNSVLSASTAPTSASGGTDEEAHFKRKPSSSDLSPETDLRLHGGAVDDLRLSDKSSLAKRLSFKKRRGAAN